VGRTRSNSEEPFGQRGSHWSQWSPTGPPSGGKLWVGILGPLLLRLNGSTIDALPPAQRVVLALLALADGSPVRMDALVEALWGDSPPASAVGMIHTYVSRLRGLLAHGSSSRGEYLLRDAGGYRLDLSKDELDLCVFRGWLAVAEEFDGQGDIVSACQVYEQALALWRGDPLENVEVIHGYPAIVALAAEYKRAVLDYSVVAVKCGRHEPVLTKLRALIVKNPLDEVARARLMVALASAGHQSEALQTYEDIRDRLDTELGVSPGPAIRDIHAKILREEIPLASNAISLTRYPSPAIITDFLGSAEDPSRLTEVRTTPEEAAVVDVRSSPPFQPSTPRGPTERPAQLPADVADFTGRGDQVRRLSDLLVATPRGDKGVVRVALVAGYGGLGKTSLAIHVAHRIRGGFPDGQLYVDLLGSTANPIPPGEVLGRFMSDLGIRGREIPIDEAGRAARYRTALAGRRVLMVLDSARDAAQVRPLLPGDSSCVVLITSRSRMPDLASTKRVDIDVLEDDDAFALFSSSIGSDRAVAEPEATAEVLDACGGLPLAIRICAARLASRSGWTIRTMADRLRDEHRRLDELAVGDLAVRASFEVSFASLPTPTSRRSIDAAQAFRALGLWQGPTISTLAAAALFGAAEDEASDALETLIDANLLECISPDQYKFHDLIRVYASERATDDIPESDRQAAITRLLSWYMCTADAAATAVTPYRYNIPLESFGPDAPAPLGFTGAEDALAWYDGERYNVVNAVRLATSAQLHEVAWRISASLFVIFNSRGDWANAIAIYRIGLDSARVVRNRHGEAWLLNNLGRTLGISGDVAGLDYLQQSLEIRREIGDQRGEAQSANNLADLMPRFGMADEGIQMLYSTRELNRALNDRYGEAIALGNIGDALLGLGRAEEALDWLRQSSTMLAEFKDLDLIGYAASGAGRCYLSLGRHDEAVQSFLDALANHQASDNRQRQALTLRFLGRAQASAERLAQARDSFLESAAIYARLGDLEQATEVHAECTELAADGR